MKKDGFDRNMFDVFDNKPHSAIKYHQVKKMIHPSYPPHVVHYWFKSQKASHGRQIPEFASFSFGQEWAQ